MIIIFIFLLGLAVGSFLNAVIYRLKVGKGFLKGHSICPQCKHPLGVKDLIPLFSFIIQKGRCRYCGQRISWQYPLVELVTAFLFIIFYLKFGFQIQFFIYLVEACFLIIIFVHDLRYYLILDKVVWPAIIFTLGGNLILGVRWVDFVLGGIIGLGFFLFQFLVSRGKWIGGGDIRLGLFLGIMLGTKGIIATLFLAYILGALVGLTLMILGKKKWGDKLPLGTFLSATGVFILLYGSEIINWYLNILG